MLCITRKDGQEIEIRHAGQTLRLVVVRVNGRDVGLGFVGPRTFEIVRDDARRRTPKPLPGVAT